MNSYDGDQKVAEYLLAMKKKSIEKWQTCTNYGS